MASKLIFLKLTSLRETFWKKRMSLLEIGGGKVVICRSVNNLQLLRLA